MTVKKDTVLFEDALDMTGFSKFNLLLCLLCGSIIVGMTFEIFSVSYLVPSSSCELGTTSSQQGLIAGVPLAGIIATSHIWGYLADTRGRRKILTISMAIGFVSGALAALSPNWITFGVLKFVSSSAVAGAFALSVTLLSECTPRSKRSALVLLTTTVHLTSMGLMAVITIPILPLEFSYYVPYLKIQFNSWRLLGLIFSVPCCLCAIGTACFYESPKYLLSVGQNEKALEVLRSMFVMNSGQDGDKYQVNSVVLDEENATHFEGLWASLVAQTLPMLKPPLLKSTILLAFLFSTVFICINPLVVWLPFIVDVVMKSVESGTGDVSLCQMMRTMVNSTTVEMPNDCTMNHSAMTLVFGISVFLAVLNVVMSSIIGLVGRKRLFIGIQLIAGTAALCITVSSTWILNSVLFMTFLWGIMNFGMLTTFSVDIFPTYVKAMAVCLTLMVGRGSAVFGINLLKKLLDDNCEAAFYIFGSITIVGGLVGFLLPSDVKIADQKKILKI